MEGSFTHRLRLDSLAFVGEGMGPAELTFSSGLNVLYGASNTGKSFALRSIDFMLGGSSLPDITERQGYEQALLSLKLPKTGESTLVRALVGGPIEVRRDDLTPSDNSPATSKNIRRLSGRHNANSPDNISQFLLDELDLAGKRIAADVYGRTRPLSFRDLARYCLVDEAAIQSQTSPVESGQYISPTPEHSVLKLLLSGQDDSKIVPVVDRKTFKTSTAAKLEVIDDTLADLDAELAADFPDAAGLAEHIASVCRQRL